MNPSKGFCLHCYSSFPRTVNPFQTLPLEPVFIFFNNNNVNLESHAPVILHYPLCKYMGIRGAMGGYHERLPRVIRTFHLMLAVLSKMSAALFFISY